MYGAARARTDSVIAMRARGAHILETLWAGAKYRSAIYNRHYSETVMGCFLVVWGLWFILGPQIFVVNSQAWRVVSEHMSEEVLGGLSVTLGLLWLWALIAQSRQGRQWAAFLGLGWWSFVTLVVMSSTFWSTGTPTYGMLAVYCFWTYIRIGTTREPGR